MNGTEQLKDFDWSAYIRAQAALHGYTLEADQLARVATQLQLIARNAAPVLDLALEDRVEPAAVFRP